MLVMQLREPAMRALRWIDEYGDRDGDGFVEYEKRSERGLDNQSWKDSGDSQRFADGRLAKAPIASAEVQGYVYDAKKRVAELAREVWRDRALAERLDRDADRLKKRFDQAYWVEERGGYYALALDSKKKRVDSMCSNMGHLLWSGIVPSTRVDAVVDALMGDALWSGWGVRTMSTDDAGYNPLSYHNGSVWPHDNSLIAWGLMRYARWPEALRIVQRMLEAAAYFGHELPEVFSGLPRTQTPFPIAYPTAARPQAWAAGTPVLLLQVLLGLQPDRRRQALETIAPLELPSWAGSLRLSGVRVFGNSWDVHLEDGRVRIEES
jgi:glycogen debranching enzyme